MPYLLDFSKYVMASIKTFFNKIIRLCVNFVKQSNDKTNLCGIKKAQDNFFVYRIILNYIKI